jgi:quercetin dioxygenase-like cupin family protein
MNITRNGSQPSSRGPSDYFTGDVRVDSPFQRNAPARVSGAVVTFEPGAAPPGTRIPLVRR